MCDWRGQLGELGKEYFKNEGDSSYQMVAEIAWKDTLLSGELKGGSVVSAWEHAVSTAELSQDKDPGSGPKHRLKRLLNIFKK